MGDAVAHSPGAEYRDSLDIHGSPEILADGKQSSVSEQTGEEQSHQDRAIRWSGDPVIRKSHTEISLIGDHRAVKDADRGLVDHPITGSPDHPML
jgi:hypothetical protein